MKSTIDIRKILEVMDDMDRLVKAVDAKYGRGGDLDPIDSGFLLVRENLEKALNSEGLFRIQCFSGDPFDVAVHDAVGTYALSDFERYGAEIRENVVHEVVRSGWRSGSEVLRHAQVIVTE